MSEKEVLEGKITLIKLMLNLFDQGRDLIKEGELQKISRNKEGARYFILLSDYLLYTDYKVEFL